MGVLTEAQIHDVVHPRLAGRVPGSSWRRGRDAAALGAFVIQGGGIGVTTGAPHRVRHIAKHLGEGLELAIA
jgi:hypothetical protein